MCASDTFDVGCFQPTDMAVGNADFDPRIGESAFDDDFCAFVQHEQFGAAIVGSAFDRCGAHHDDGRAALFESVFGRETISRGATRTQKRKQGAEEGGFA